MNDWNAWLDTHCEHRAERAGAVIRSWPRQHELLRALLRDEDEAADGDRRSRTAPWGVDPDLVVIDVTGDDAVAFLQSQFCNDVLAVAAGAVRPNGYCSPKGRLLALFLALPLDDGIRLLLPGELADDFVKRLRMFVLRARVTLEARDDLAVIGEIELAASSIADNPQDNGELRASDAAVVADATHPAWSLRRDGEVERLLAPCGQEHFRRSLLIAPVAAMQARWNAYAERVAGVAAWLAADIVDGRPRLATATRERFVPQMLNLEQIGALSFRKGCYPGQEIVARMQYLGRLKRHMRRFQARGAVAAAPGDAVMSAGGDREAGSVVSAVLSDGQTDLLAVVQIDLAEEPLLIDGTPLVPRSMPYDPPAGAVPRQQTSA